MKRSDSALLVEIVLFFIVAKVLYEVLGVGFVAMNGDFRAILAFSATFILYDKIGKKIVEKVI